METFRSKTALIRQLRPLCIVALATTFTNASPGHASFVFADLVAERNQATAGLANETFPNGADRVNRFNGALAYNVPIGQAYSVGGDIAYSLGLEYSSNIWNLDATGTQVLASIDGRFDAGAGWHQSFGELIAPSSTGNPSSFWLYRSPKGSISRFYQTLNVGDPVVFNTFYTRDGTYLRLTTTGTQSVVAFTHGVEQVFQQRTNGTWRFAEERDQYGNFFAVTETANQRQITDRHGRTQTIHLQADPANANRQVIDRIEVATFGGTTAVYDLSYTTVTVDLPPEDSDPTTPVQQAIALLTSIAMPNGEQMTFEYFALGESAVAASGRLKTVKLNTGGLLDYTYQVVALPKVPGALHTADAIGIATRSSRASNGLSSPGGISLPVGVWQFAMNLDRDRDTTSAAKPRELTTTVTYPDGHSRAYKFSAYAGGDAASDHANPATFHLRDYAFPFSKRLAAANESLFDNMLIHEADGSLVRTYRVRYNFVACNGCWDQQPSSSGSRTLFDDGSGIRETNLRWTRQDLGRWRTSVSPDNVHGGPKHFVYRTYMPGAPAANAPWVDLDWTERRTELGNESRTVQRCVDNVTGQVLRERTLASDTPAPNDLIRAYTYHPTGERATTSHFGGDVQAVPTGDLCALSLPTTAQYVERRTYRHGSLESTAWLNADGTSFLETYRATIDSNTGLVASMHGADGFTWTYTYDAAGRQTSSAPPPGHGGATTRTFQPASGTQSAVVVAITTAANGTSELSKVETEIGPFGDRVMMRRWSDGGWITTRQIVDAMGRPVTAIHADGSTTRNLGYDALGRVLIVRPREGSVHDKTFSYLGHATTRTFKIGKSWDAATNDVVEIDRSITTTVDRFARTIERHTIDADGEQRTETYARGLGGHVHTSTTTDGVTTDTHSTPKRTDNRGFLIETVDGDPITGYDVLGNRILTDFGEGPVAQLFDRAGRLTEQREGSITGPLWSRNTYANASLGNDYRGGKLVSSLRMNRNIPHIAGGQVTVQDEYSYTGDRGSVSTVRTSVFAGPQTIFTFETARSVDPSGSVGSLTFPDCDPATNDSFSLCTPRAARVMQTERIHGRLVRFSATVGGVHEPWVDGVMRDAAGRITETTLGNGIVATETPHVSGGDRLARLTLNHPSSGVFYDSGLAQYDGLGKLVKLGNQRHVTDHAYRLAIQPIPTPGSSNHTPSTVNRDYLGMATGRDYNVPYRFDPASGVQEQVNEIYVYGPGNRLIWNRVFNSFQASTYRNSLDRWLLVDPSGRAVREASSLTHYAGTQPQWSNAAVSAVALHVAGELTDDRIYLGRDLIGRTDDRPNAPSRVFLHQDFFGRRFAESSADGTVDTINAPLF